LVTSSAYVVNPGLYTSIPYDPYKDFVPVAELGTSPNVILVNPKLAVNSIADLIAHAKAHPDELNYASPGVGTTPQLSVELFKLIAAIRITHVPFSGAGPAIQAILGGTAQVAVAALPSAHPHIESGALKALAVTGQRRGFDLPDVPTMTELGYKDFISDTFHGFLAPIKTAPAVIDLLAKKSIEILKRPAITKQLADNGFEVIANGPDGIKSTSTTKCQNGDTSSLKPASSRSDRINLILAGRIITIPAAAWATKRRCTCWNAACISPASMAGAGALPLSTPRGNSSRPGTQA
jgi:tripartite-type tricarboxylate transporter receptor subunit TctC